MLRKAKILSRARARPQNGRDLPAGADPDCASGTTRGKSGDDHGSGTLWVGYNGQAMNSPFLDLLNQVADGIVIYEPVRRDRQGLSEFQDIVHRLREMERLGLIGRLFEQKRTSRGAEVIDLVMVQGGLTAEGQRLLAEHGGDALTG
jgi:hypothetical protein